MEVGIIMDDFLNRPIVESGWVRISALVFLCLVVGSEVLRILAGGDGTDEDRVLKETPLVVRVLFALGLVPFLWWALHAPPDPDAALAFEFYP
jgi:hypothetical protein